jgi:hypothetical protein
LAGVLVAAGAADLLLDSLLALAEVPEVPELELLELSPDDDESESLLPPLLLVDE